MRFHKTPCPICSNASVYTDTAVAGGAIDHATGKPVKPGDTIDRCDSCGATTVKTKPKSSSSSASTRRPSTTKPKAPARKRASAAKPKRPRGGGTT